MAKTPQIVKLETIRPRLLTVEDAAKYVGLAPKTFRNRLGPKAEDPLPIPFRRYGKKILFEVKDLNRFVNSLPKEMPRQSEDQTH